MSPIVGTPRPCAAGQWVGLWADETDTATFAQRLASSPAILNATLTLQGDLGAGKTTFVRHLLRALGVQGRIKSPTYAVVEPHTSHTCALLPPGQTLSVWHFDYYRFTDPREWEDAGFRELFASPGLKLVEWPERAGDTLPAVDASLCIEADEPFTAASSEAPAEGQSTARRVRLNALTATGQRIVSSLTA